MMALLLGAAWLVAMATRDELLMTITFGYSVGAVLAWLT